MRKAALIVVGGLLLVACGGDDDSDVEPADEASCSAGFEIVDVAIQSWEASGNPAGEAESIQRLADETFIDPAQVDELEQLVVIQDGAAQPGPACE